MNRSLPIFWISVLTVFLNSNPHSQAASIPQTQNDLWDISSGVTITGTSGIRSGFQASDAFGTRLSQLESGNTVFVDGRANGFTHYVEWQTLGPILLTGFNLFAAGDGAAYANEREFGQFILKAKLRGTDEFTTIYSFTPAHPYDFLDPISSAIISAQLPEAIEAQFFRAEFVQFNTGRGYDGPRIIELDGYGTELQPSVTHASDDLWDVSMGISITGSSGFRGGFFGTDIFGSSFSIEPCQAVFSDGLPNGTTHFVEWNTPTSVALTRFNLFASGDEAIYNHEREFAQFVLKAKRRSADEFTTIYTFNPAHPYPFLNPSSTAILSVEFAEAVEARFFRAEFMQWNAGRGYDGPRVIELDGFGSPIPDLPPVAVGQTVALAEDSSVVITLAATDPDDGPNIYNIVSSPIHGTLSGTAPNLTYTPNANFFGTDAFEFLVANADGASSHAFVNISVTPVNDPPGVSNQTFSTPEDTVLVISLAGSDVDNDSLSFTVFEAQHGLLEWVINPDLSSNLVYIPGPNFFGTDSFAFRASDGTATSVTSTGTISVTPVNDAPIASSGTFTGLEDAALLLALSGSDPDEDTLSIEITTPPQHGTLSDSTSGRVYTPNANFFGEDLVRFRVSDGTSQSEIATVMITIQPLDDAPIALPTTVTASEDTTTTFVLNVADIDGGPRTLSIVSGPANGTLSGQAPNLTFTPGTNFYGTDSMRFAVSNGSGSASEAAVTIQVASVNDAPRATALTVSTAFNTPIAITLSGADVESSALTYTVITGPTNGILSGAAPNLTFAPALGWSGLTSFSFVVNDGSATSAPATVTVNVAAQTSPVALHYGFDESTSTIANDLSGNGNNGTLRNNPARIAGFIGAGAVSFPQINDYIDIPATTSLADLELQGGGGMTIAFWINTSALANGIIVTKGINSGMAWEISMNASGRLSFFRDYTGASDLNLRFESQVIAGQWQHFVFTWTGAPGTDSVRLYRNGVLRPLSFGSAGSGSKLSDATKALNIGGLSAGYGINGSMDDFRLYNRVLTAAEITALANTR